MQYVHWMLILCGVFLALERLRPWRRQPVLRRGWSVDLGYVALNGHFLGVLLAKFTGPASRWVSDALGLEVARARLHGGLASGWPAAVQFLVALVVLDFLQWCIHNALHRVPWLWRFHQVHHSIEVLDWAGNLRFHWMEIVVYKSVQYVPLALLGFDGGVLLAHAVFSTFMGFWNHSNLDVDIGPLRYVFNNPRMHVWHHDRDEVPLPPGVNFGINLSVWDWWFKTAWLPTTDRQPRRLGFAGIDRFPTTLVGQLLFPLPLTRLSRRPAAPPR